MSTAKRFLRERTYPLLGVALCLGVGFLLWGALVGYPFLDEKGWIPRTRVLDVYVQGAWPDGKARTCGGVDAEVNDTVEIASLHCPAGTLGGSPHRSSVRFWGRIARHDIRSIDETSGASFQWRCTRKSDQYTCKAIN